MMLQLNLKEIEKRAFRSTYQDGLLDIQYGLIVACMSIFIYRPESGYSPLNILLAVVAIVVTNLLFMAGKRFITLPRMGMVKFGEIRHKKIRRMAIVLGIFILFQIALVIITSRGIFPSSNEAWHNNFFGNQNSSLLIVAAIGSLIVGSGMIVMSYFSDFDRGLYISILMAAAVFLMILLNRPLWPILIGLGIILPGITLLVRFITRYPISKEEGERD